MAPLTGFYNWVSVYDYASLYPTIIRQFNISPDVYLGQADTLDEDVLEKNIVCESGAVFKKDEDGFLKILLTDIYNQRKDHQKIKKDCKKQIKTLMEIKANKLKRTQ